MLPQAKRARRHRLASALPVESWRGQGVTAQHRNGMFLPGSRSSLQRGPKIIWDHRHAPSFLLPTYPLSSTAPGSADGGSDAITQISAAESCTLLHQIKDANSFSSPRKRIGALKIQPHVVDERTRLLSHYTWSFSIVFFFLWLKKFVIISLL